MTGNTDVDRAAVVGILAMLSMWFWGPLLRHLDVEDDRVAKALFGAGIIATAAVAGAGGALLLGMA